MMPASLTALKKGRTGDTCGKNNSVASKWLLVKRFFANHNIWGIWGTVKIYFSVKYRSYPSFLGSSLVFFQCLAQFTTSKPSTCHIKYAYIAVYMHCSLCQHMTVLSGWDFFSFNRHGFRYINPYHPYISLTNQPHVGEYTIHGWYGKLSSLRLSLSSAKLLQKAVMHSSN